MKDPMVTPAAAFALFSWQPAGARPRSNLTLRASKWPRSIAPGRRWRLATPRRSNPPRASIGGSRSVARRVDRGDRGRRTKAAHASGRSLIGIRFFCFSGIRGRMPEPISVQGAYVFFWIEGLLWRNAH
jgi:hypothetical protein